MWITPQLSHQSIIRGKRTLARTQIRGKLSVMEEQATFTLYLDESGTSDLFTLEEYDKRPNLESHCTLMGVAIPHHKKPFLKTTMNEMKKDIFRSDEIVLHSSEIRGRSGAFCVFHYSPDIYEKFKSEMNILSNTLRPVIICSSLNKKKWVELYPRKMFFKDDPYEQAFIYLLERYAHFLNNQPYKKVVGHIDVESRSPQKDKRIQEVFHHVKQYGTQYCKTDNFEKLFPRLEFHKKKMNVPGLQLSDYFAYPFYINHKYPQNENKHYEFLEQFIYPGDYGKYGYKKWPI